MVSVTSTLCDSSLARISAPWVTMMFPLFWSQMGIGKASPTGCHVPPGKFPKSFSIPRMHVEVREERGDLRQLQVVLGDLHVVAGRQDIGVVSHNIGADLVVVVIRDEAIDLAGELRERELVAGRASPPAPSSP